MKNTCIYQTVSNSVSLFPNHTYTLTMYWPEESRLPLLPLIILPLLPMLANLEVFKVPVSVRSIAISLKLRAAWILDWGESNWEGLSEPIIKQSNYNLVDDHACWVCCVSCLTDLALLAVQVELVLADSHGPDGLDEGWTGIPRVHSNATVTKRPSCHRRPTVGADIRPPYIHWILNIDSENPPIYCLTIT